MLAIPAKAKPTLLPCLREFWTTPARNRVLYGGRSSGKSWDAAGFAVFLAANYRVKFMCVRQFQNKIDESVYSLLKLQIERFGLLDEFDIQKAKIIHKRTKSEFLFYGLWRNISEIKSTESVDVCWIEEAHNLTKEQWDILEPTLRSEGSQFWIVFNPRLLSDFVYRRFITNTPPKTVKRKINYEENPFLSQTIRDVIEAKRLEDPDEFAHIYGGEPLHDDDAAIIKRSWLLASIDLHKLLGIEPSGRKRLGFDVADSGKDKCATVEAHGIVATHLEEWKAGEDELLKSASRVHNRALVTGSDITYDSIGVGAFAGGHFQAINEELKIEIAYHKFNAGGEVYAKNDRIDPADDNSPLNGDFYENAKAQEWWGTAKRFRNAFNARKLHEAGQDWRSTGLTENDLISISSEIEKADTLIDELSTPRRAFSKRGKSMVESKADLDKRDVPSPNKADAFVMAFSQTQEYEPPYAVIGNYL